MPLFYRKGILFILSLVPFFFLIYNAATNNLGANPIEKIRLFTGDWTLYFLLITLAVTPLRKVTGWIFLCLSAFFQLPGPRSVLRLGGHLAGYPEAAVYHGRHGRVPAHAPAGLHVDKKNGTAARQKMDADTPPDLRRRRTRGNSFSVAGEGGHPGTGDHGCDTGNAAVDADPLAEVFPATPADPRCRTVTTPARHSMPRL